MRAVSRSKVERSKMGQSVQGQRQNRRQLAALIRELGFVQLDSIRTLERAHHMILFARNNSYRPRHLRKLLEQDAAIFENWTHDAAVIPTDFYPFWMRRFERTKGSRTVVGGIGIPRRPHWNFSGAAETWRSSVVKVFRKSTI